MVTRLKEWWNKYSQWTNATNKQIQQINKQIQSRIYYNKKILLAYFMHLKFAICIFMRSCVSKQSWCKFIPINACYFKDVDAKRHALIYSMDITSHIPVEPSQPFAWEVHPFSTAGIQQKYMSHQCITSRYYFYFIFFVIDVFWWLMFIKIYII